MSLKVLIADDEPSVREGIKTIIDWSTCGFEICGEAANGMETLEKILEFSPDLVLVDIKMPKLNGIDVVRRARNKNYKGSIIILSGYSDFAYAQSAISCGVDFYLVKPIDEDELLRAVIEVRKKLDAKKRDSANLAKAKEAVLADIFKGKNVPDPDAFGLKLHSDIYQVILVDLSGNDFTLYESFCSLLKRMLDHTPDIDMTMLAETGVFLLKNADTIQKLPLIVDSLEKYSQGFSPAPIFIAAGRAVDSVKDIALSYEDAKSIHQKRFFCDENQKYLSYEVLQLASYIKESTAAFDIDAHTEELLGYIEALNVDEICLKMGRLYDELRFIRIPPENIRSILSSVYLRIKAALNSTYKHAGLSFPSDEEVITQIGSRKLLYEILQYLKNELLRLTNAIAASSPGSTVHLVIHYINTHYMESLKLESISKKFGYTPAYLGKSIRNTVGEAFNTYLEKVRIEEAKRLLLTDLKVYEVSERAGFTDMDSFYRKFKKITGKNPGEFRKDSCL